MNLLNRKNDLTYPFPALSATYPELQRAASRRDGLRSKCAKRFRSLVTTSIEIDRSHVMSDGCVTCCRMRRVADCYD